jgi:hypothetical protein
VGVLRAVETHGRQLSAGEHLESLTRKIDRGLPAAHHSTEEGKPTPDETTERTRSWTQWPRAPERWNRDRSQVSEGITARKESKAAPAALEANIQCVEWNQD